MKCMVGVEESQELIVGYGARTLDPETAAMFERHIEFCATCRDGVATQIAVWAALDEWRALILAVVRAKRSRSAG